MTQKTLRGTRRNQRSLSGTQYALQAWERLVKRLEKSPTLYLTGCPLCDPDDGLDARDTLESLIRRGGRRSKRLRRALVPLDARFLRATSPNPFAARGTPWWRARYLD